MLVNGKDDIPYMMENKKCSKPPTRYDSLKNPWFSQENSLEILDLPHLYIYEFTSGVGYDTSWSKHETL